ncbi:MAG: hypothetical protein R2752_16860 [Vicinamibacterales bacterium]
MTIVVVLAVVATIAMVVRRRRRRTRAGGSDAGRLTAARATRPGTTRLGARTSRPTVTGGTCHKKNIVFAARTCACCCRLGAPASDAALRLSATMT